MVLILRCKDIHVHGQNLKRERERINIFGKFPGGLFFSDVGRSKNTFSWISNIGTIGKKPTVSQANILNLLIFVEIGICYA